jgi:Fe-S cluster assembly iron-binding protein IscA
MTITDAARDELLQLLAEHPGAALRVVVAGYG